MSADRLEALLQDPAPFLADPDPAVRRLAVAACAERLADETVVAALATLATDDPDAVVRAEAVELLGGAGADSTAVVMYALDDADVRVVEAAATALGEFRSSQGLAWLLDAARSHEDRLVREAAVASLGSIGDDRAVPVLIALLEEAPPQVRRRAVVALTVFDDPAIEPALRKARDDRNPMVREVAEMVMGRARDDGWTPLDLSERGAPPPPAEPRPEPRTSG